MTRRRRRRTRRTATRNDVPGSGAGPPSVRVREIAAAALVTAAISVSFASVRAQGPAARGADALAEAERLVASTVSEYESADAYVIDFRQESYWALADSTQVTTGVLAVARPARASIRYEDGGRIVVRGESLWVYVPQTNQFFSTRLDSMDTFLDPIRLLSGFTLDAEAPFAPETVADVRQRTVTLRPRPPALEPVRVDVRIDTESFLVRALTAFASSGDRTSYLMGETRLPASIPDSTFVPVRPAGAELIRGGPYGN